MRIPDGAILLDGDSNIPIDPANIRALREQIERDIEHFAALAPTHGHQAVIETADAVLLPVQMRRFVAEIRRDFGPDVEIRWIRAIDVVRRYRIRRSARARKARRGWR